MRYEDEVTDLQKQRKAILREAKEEAQRIIAEANAKIENTIREIKEAQAEKERTRLARQQLSEMQERLAAEESDEREKNADIEKKMQQILERRKRKQEKREKGASAHIAAAASGKEELRTTETSAVASPHKESMAPGDYVRLKGQHTTGIMESLQGKKAVVVFGMVKTTVALNRLEASEKPQEETLGRASSYLSKETRDDMRQRSLQFHQDIDIRGLRADEALQQITYYIDDAILVGAARVRILHGTGTGALRTLVRQYLSTVAGVTSFHDEHVQFGGAGITVVEFRES